VLKIESATYSTEKRNNRSIIPGRPWRAAPAVIKLRRELRCRGLVVRTLAIGKIARVTDLALLIPDDPVNRFTMGAAAGLFLFRIRHEVCSHILLLVAPE
jgi:hypothetical protein